MNPYETELLHRAAEVARIRRLWAQTFLLNTRKFPTDGQARAAADEDHIEAIMEAEARYEIAKSVIHRAPLAGGHHAPLGRHAPDATAHDPSQIEC